MSSPYHPMQLVFGLAIWAIWFVMVYGGLSIACEHATPGKNGSISWVNLSLMAFTMLTCGLLLFLAHRTWRDARPTWRQQPAAGRFIVRVAVILNLIAALVTLAVGLPIVMLPPCL